jgi:cyclophilin family peptidyl-prolyl cis-trans isomerase
MNTMAEDQNPTVRINTSMGSFTAELWPGEAPVTVANFLDYVEKGHYAGTIFHRVIDGFMIQGGGMTADMRQKPTGAPIKNEASSNVPNKRGTLAMARTSDINSATSQFFVNLVDNGFLDHRDDSPAGFGYCVFGRVTDGMDVVDKIASVNTTSQGPYEDVPAETITIESVEKL